MVSLKENVDLNFKVPPAFRAEFKVLAASLGITGRDLLLYAFSLAKKATQAREARA